MAFLDLSRQVRNTFSHYSNSLLDKNYQEALQRIREAKISKATELSLFGLKLTQLPPQLYELTHLESLDLSHNKLGHLPPQVRQLSNLKRLHLTKNELTKLPTELSQLVGLQSLSLNDNQFREFPLEVCLLPKLEWLNLNRNQLTKLPPEISQLTHLDWLRVSLNQLQKLPAEIVQPYPTYRFELGLQRLLWCARIRFATSSSRKDQDDFGLPTETFAQRPAQSQSDACIANRSITNWPLFLKFGREGVGKMYWYGDGTWSSGNSIFDP